VFSVIAVEKKRGSPGKTTTTTTTTTTSTATVHSSAQLLKHPSLS